MARVLRKNFFGRRAIRKNVANRTSVNTISGTLHFVRGVLREKQEKFKKNPDAYNLLQLKSAQEDEVHLKQKLASRVKERSSSVIELLPRISANPKAFIRLKRAQLKKARASKQN